MEETEVDRMAINQGHKEKEGHRDDLVGLVIARLVGVKQVGKPTALPWLGWFCWVWLANHPTCQHCCKIQKYPSTTINVLRFNSI